ncbi:MAG: hypothetical protein QXT45_06875 [Candidatus Bilamarchaeaceae archaeon]
MKVGVIPQNEKRKLVDHSNSKPKTKHERLLIFFMVILATSLFASFISPQISLFGRGLRLSLPLFMILSVFVYLTRPNAFQVLRNYRTSIALGLIYVITGTMHHIFDPQVNIFHNLVVSAAICIMVWMTVLLVRKGFPEAVEPIRWLVLITLGVSLGMGIPLLLAEPGIARLTMGNPMEDIYAAEFYPRGVANYSWYTFVAITFPVISNWLYNTSLCLWLKIIGWACLLAASAATVFSTFTMASVLLVFGALGWLGLVAFTTKGSTSRWVASVLFLTALVGLPTLVVIGSEFEATRFAVFKAKRLFEGALAVGMLEADETGRTQMFVDTIKSFLRNPFFGGWGLDPNFYIGGHSSWADTLGTQGVFGLFLWMGFLFPSLRRGKKPFSVKTGTAGGTLSWILLFAGGVLNPTFSSAIGLGLLWLFDDGAMWRQPKADQVV